MATRSASRSVRPGRAREVEHRAARRDADRVRPGAPYPLGAVWDGDGVNFSLFSSNATAVELCLFDGGCESRRLPVSDQTAEAWHVYVPGLGPGQCYGYRVYGPHEPANGHRFNAAKLLLDPYARAIDGALVWRDELFGYPIGSLDADLAQDPSDSAAWVPKAVVVDPRYDWEDDRPPRTPWHDSILYETHVKGLTVQHPDVPEAARGTYAGLASPAAIGYLRSLGVTAVQLLPVHWHVDERALVERGLHNYWGYNTLAFFTPDARYAAAASPQGQVTEFKDMVKALHRAGIEVILDVVYTHTAEGNELGPTLSFRGIDNAAYYRLQPDQPRRYKDFTGCGNTLDMRHPRVLQLVMDSLRYWVQEMHVDGFRFDLASALARGERSVDRLSAFFDIIQQDPVLCQVKLIAEPWDLGEGGYQLGHFPPLWSEWNARYRDAVRDYWRSAPGALGELAQRLAGSGDIYAPGGRRSCASINFVTAHDGFTLRDLVSYNAKYNEANGEDNRDGGDDNRSWNGGAEGETEDAAVNALRGRQQRNLFATLLLSQGIPMLLGGDELGRTQGGNNNAYCQDNALSWYDWSGADHDLLEFVRRLIALRMAHPVLRRHPWLRGHAGAGTPDVAWLRPDGREMGPEDWRWPQPRALGMYLNGAAIPGLAPDGAPLVDASMYALFNAHVETVRFTLPSLAGSAAWQLVLATHRDQPFDSRAEYDSHARLDVPERCVMLLQSTPPAGA